MWCWARGWPPVNRSGANHSTVVHLFSIYTCHTYQLLTSISYLREQGQCVYLNLQAMKRLDRMITRSYADWVEDAPEEYKSDCMLTPRLPVAITLRFRQNEELASSVKLQQEEHDNWDRDWDYTRIRYLTLALATHIQYVHPYVSAIWTTSHCGPQLWHRACTVRRWEDRELVDIMDSTPDGVYTSMALNVRDLLSLEDLEDLPMFNNEGNKIPIYCHNGFNIPPVIYPPPGVPRRSELNSVQIHVCPYGSTLFCADPHYSVWICTIPHRSALFCMDLHYSVWIHIIPCGICVVPHHSAWIQHGTIFHLLA